MYLLVVQNNVDTLSVFSKVKQHYRKTKKGLVTVKEYTNKKNKKAIISGGLAGLGAIAGGVYLLKKGKLPQLNKKVLLNKVDDIIPTNSKAVNKELDFISKYIDTEYGSIRPEVKDAILSNPQRLVRGTLGSKYKEFGMNEVEAIAVNRYMTSGYRAVNKRLRDLSNRLTTDKSSIQETKFLIKGMQKLPKIDTKDIKQFDRYVELSDADIAKYVPGKTISENAFASTTAVRKDNTTVNLAGLAAGNSNVKLVYKPKVNTSARDVGKVNTIESNEAVYLPGTKFKVNNIKEQEETFAGTKKLFKIIELEEQ